MAYNGTIDLIAGIRPKNSGTFPLVDAKDVYVSDEARLSNYLSGLSLEDVDGEARLVFNELLFRDLTLGRLFRLFVDNGKVCVLPNGMSAVLGVDLLGYLILGGAE